MTPLNKVAKPYQALEWLGKSVLVKDTETGTEVDGRIVGWSRGKPRWLVSADLEANAYGTDLEVGNATVVFDGTDLVYVRHVWADTEDYEFMVREAPGQGRK